MANTITLAQYKAMARVKLNRASFDGTKLAQFADEANKEICNNRIWRFMEKKFPGTISTDFNEYDFPDANMQALISFVVIGPDSGILYPAYMPYKIFDQKYPNPTSLPKSAPVVWTSFGTVLILSTLPDQVYTMTLKYVKAPTTLLGAAETATVDVPDDFSEVMTLGMVRRALQAQDMYNEAQVLFQEWQDKIDAMDVRYQSRQFGKPLRMGKGQVTKAGLGAWD